MLESMITPPPPKGIEPDYPYEGFTMFRVVKEPVAMTLTYRFDGSPMTVHYGSQDSISSGTIGGTSSLDTLSIPANVTEFFLKQVTPDVTLTSIRISGPNITEVTWNPELRATNISLRTSPKLIKVSSYLPKEITNLNSAFYNCQAFNQDISSWDTGNVTNMNSILYGAMIFNQNLSGWDVSKVTTHANFDGGATAWQADYKPKFLV